MTKKIISFGILLFLIGCDQLPDLPETWKKSGEVSSPSTDLWKESDKKAEVTTTIPWKGNAVAADTFIKISKKADLGVVNIGTTTTIQRKSPFDFGGPQGGGSPFEDFFGDDLFKYFFGGPGGPEGRTQPKEFKQASLGSGFIIHESGLIVTNNHVVDMADVITVTIGSDREYKAKIIGADPKTDVALIKIEATEKLEPLVLGDSDDLQVGEIVVAIGNPFGLSHTVTQGIVSAKERSIGFGPYDNFIQTDASINPGNSGGPLLNLNAEVVGINAAMQAQGQGIGFAIPINLAKNIITQLKENGSVTRGWLGVWIQKVDPELAKSFGLKDAQGALVSKVQKIARRTRRESNQVTLF
jgi:serine protease Do